VRGGGELTATAGTTWSFCNQDAPPFLIVQRDSRVFIKVATPMLLPESSHVQNWRIVRIADVANDVVNDVVVVTNGQPSWLNVFRGQSTASPLSFDFQLPVYQLQLPYGYGDGSPGLYVVQVDVVQVDETSGAYCAFRGPGYANAWWGGGVQPSKWWTPPY
jgi:hypothetical protein